MVGVFSTAFLTTGIFVSSFLPQASSSAALSPLPIIGQESFHVVKTDESLTDIAKEEYHDETKVPVILSDNPWIADPNHIEEGWQVKIRKNPLLKDATDPVVSSISASEDTLLPSMTPTPSVLPVLPSEAPSQATQSAQDFPTPTFAPTLAVPTAQPATTGSGPLSDAQITFLGNCESGLTATRNSGNGFYGAFQFTIGTWNAMNTGYARADLAPLDVQKDAVQRLLQRSSIFTQFPGCANKMRNLGLI